MNDDDTNIPGDKPLDANKLPEPGATQRGEFIAEAVVFLRRGKQSPGAIECIVQYEGDQFVPNPANPQGDAVPDMSNPAVHFARWVEVALPHLAGLSAMNYHLHITLQNVVGKQAEMKPSALRLVDTSGNKLQ